MRKFFSRISTKDFVLGMAVLAIVEMVVPKVATSIVSVGTDIKSKVVK